MKDAKSLKMKRGLAKPGSQMSFFESIDNIRMSPQDLYKHVEKVTLKAQ